MSKVKAKSHETRNERRKAGTERSRANAAVNLACRVNDEVAHALRELSGKRSLELMVRPEIKGDQIRVRICGRVVMKTVACRAKTHEEGMALFEYAEPDRLETVKTIFPASRLSDYSVAQIEGRPEVVIAPGKMCATGNKGPDAAAALYTFEIAETYPTGTDAARAFLGLFNVETE
jgi:hypothetical protein